MGKYKVGDVVRVREDLVEGEVYYDEDGDRRNDVTSEMMDLAGQEVTIVDETTWGYELKEDAYKYGWTDEMFAGLASDVKDGENAADEPSVSDEPSVPNKSDESDNPESYGVDFDCSEAEEDFLEGDFVCTDSNKGQLIARGDVIYVKSGEFRFNGVRFHHVFSVSAIVWALGTRFGVETDFVKLREAR